MITLQVSTTASTLAMDAQAFSNAQSDAIDSIGANPTKTLVLSTKQDAISVEAAGLESAWTPE